MNEVEQVNVPQPAHSSSASPAAGPWVNLAEFDNSGYNPGRGAIARGLWYFISLLFFENGWFPFMGPKRAMLRMFGARVGRGLVIKPRVWIKYPWRLEIGDYCWIGLGAWIENLADVRIGSHVCISQQVYICTGSHDYRRRTFDLIARPVEISDGAWVGARVLVLGGITVGANSVVAAGSVVPKDVPRAVIVAGQPARIIAERRACDH